MVRALSVTNAGALHPAAWPCGLLVVVTVGRLPEVVPVLSVLPLGKIAVLFTVLTFLMAKDQPTNGLFQLPGTKSFAIIVILAFVGISFSIWKSWSLEQFFGRFLSLAILYYSVVALGNSRRNCEFIMFSLVLSALIVAAAIVSSSAVGRARLGSTYDPNDIAFVLVLCLPYVIYFAVRTHGYKRVLYFLCAAVFAVLTMRTQSRGGFLGLAAVAGYMVFFRPGSSRSKFSKLVAGTLVLLVAFAVLWQLAPQEARDRIQTLTNLESDYNIDDEEGRLVVWRHAGKNVLAKPWGHGLGTSSAAYLASGGRWLTTHNSLLQIGVELGVLGMLLWLLMIFKAFRSLADMRDLSAHAASEEQSLTASDPAFVAYVLKASLIGYIVCGFFLSQAYASLFFVTAALAGSFAMIFAAPVDDDMQESQT